MFNGNKICLIIAAIFFSIGALLPVFMSEGSVRRIDWLCAGFAMATWAVVIAGH